MSNNSFINKTVHCLYCKMYIIMSNTYSLIIKKPIDSFKTYDLLNELGTYDWMNLKYYPHAF